MDQRTGKLIQLEPGEELRDGYVPVPDELWDEAMRMAQEGERVSLRGKSPLSQFRRDCLRRDEKRKARRRRNNKLARRGRAR